MDELDWIFIGLIVSIIFLMGVIFYGIGLDYEHTPPPEQAVMYYKDIDVKVVSSQTYSTFGKVPQYKQEITVKSEEYGLEETFNLYDSGIFANMPYWNVQEGDIIQAVLHSWVMESTGEVVEREIDRLD